YKEKLEAWDIPFEECRHTPELLLTADLVIKSPGIPDTVPIVRAIPQKGIRVVSEIEFAGWYNRAKTICVTGSNGKTTTATLVFEVLKRGGWDVGLGGNIGRSLAYQVATQEHDWYVLELSSFQLDGMHDFRADVAVLMNITPDHLDRYENRLQNYVDSKFRIVRNQGPEQTFIFCDDDPITTQNRERYTGMQWLPFSVRHSVSRGAWLEGGTIRAAYNGQRFEMPVRELKIQGIHNTYNAMAAILSGLIAGVDPEGIRNTLQQFSGVEHRLEPVAEIDGVLYLNDSKATNVDSVWYALESMTRPVIWIAGGTDKGNDYRPLMELAAHKVKALVALGADNRKLLEAFEGVVPVIRDTHNLEEAMRAAVDLARSGDAVLLSPACASFDLFQNYEDRGRQFKAWVAALK
ncbi:MAG: UDP-N-acetylmuramoyl-L-alanine--D-glutamate ligase, partial [Rikenellaceae bacterium]|nr:UDP-N-acetylmuramoyl-L-alanine--D-glutamate ligase [Rikenellaceae bacterium]